MRITGGSRKGLILQAVSGQGTRPTSDRAREALFNILSANGWGVAFSGLAFLDAFGGTGALGLESLSRGADFGWFFESARPAQRILLRNSETLNLQDKIQLFPRDILASCPAFETLSPARKPPGLVFLDPPYGKSLIPRALGMLEKKGWLNARPLIVAETGTEDETKFLNTTGNFKAELYDQRRYGMALFSFFRPV